ncbi:ribosomal protein S18-alanine N-acetyltransferase [Candidatus Soleaferrea massiliensis]|uniref:ribosomal protein S18-alanine N-acetyltransferase n=1 Tax=Candidatus Soleaferrea massiliensis TaxID=1470354 RepID=UPI00058C560F|nr:ribosomal protein S18-alanine N-acetyltransferase [Candidatus Soleaferrea massiliensis]
MRFTIEQLDGRYIPDMVEIEKECFSAPWSYESFAQELVNRMAVYSVAVSDKRCVGYMGMHHIIDEGYITNIAVTNGARRHGVATALMEQMLTYARKSGLRMMSLEVRQSNQVAIDFYRKHGFEIVGFRKNYYTNPTEDGHIMTKILLNG